MEINELRLATLRTIAQVCEEHQLPVPTDIRTGEYSTGRRYVTFELGDGDEPGLLAWVDFLDLPRAVYRTAPEHGHRWFDAEDYGSNLWLGWDCVRVTVFMARAER